MSFKDFIKFHKWGTSGIIHNDLKWYVKNDEDVIYLAKYIIFRSDKLLDLQAEKNQYAYCHLVDEINLLCAAITCLLDFASDSEMTFEVLQCFVNGAVYGTSDISSTDLLIEDYRKVNSKSLALRFYDSFKINYIYNRLDTASVVSERLSLLYFLLDHKEYPVSEISDENSLEEQEEREENAMEKFNPYGYVKEKLGDGLGHSKSELSRRLLKEGYSQTSIDNIFKTFSVDWNEQLQMRTKNIIDNSKDYYYNMCNKIQELSDKLLIQGFTIDETKEVVNDPAIQKTVCYNDLSGYMRNGGSFISFDLLKRWMKNDGFTENVCNEALKMVTDSDIKEFYNNNLRHAEAWYCTQKNCTKDDLVGYLAEKDADSEMCSYIFEHGNFDFAEHEQTKAENSEPDDEFDFPSDIDYSSI